MIGAVFGELGFKSLLILVFGISAKSQVLYHVRNFVKLVIFGIAHAGAELNARRHHAGARDINKKPSCPVFKLDFLDCVFHK